MAIISKQDFKVKANTFDPSREWEKRHLTESIHVKDIVCISMWGYIVELTIKGKGKALIFPPRGHECDHEWTKKTANDIASLKNSYREKQQKEKPVSIRIKIEDTLCFEGSLNKETGEFEVIKLWPAEGTKFKSGGEEIPTNHESLYVTVTGAVRKVIKNMRTS